MKFKTKVKKMKASEIILAMVNGLKKGHVNVSMGTYGKVLFGQCWGCAATNTICEISKVKFTIDTVANGRAEVLKVDDAFLTDFELAIDHLRRGSIVAYNVLAKNAGFATIKRKPRLALPFLGSGNYLYDLGPYEKLAEYNKKLEDKWKEQHSNS